MRTFNFQSILHTDAKTWADAGPLKVKYLVNTVNFIRKLRGNGLIFKNFVDCCPILKERAFEQCIAT